MVLLLRIKSRFFLSDLAIKRAVGIANIIVIKVTTTEITSVFQSILRK